MQASSDPSAADLSTGGNHDLEIFIIAHDYAIIGQLEEQQHFSQLPSYRYILVGNRDRGVSPSDKVIVADLLPDNIERYKNLLSFTAWYAASKNQLVKTPYVSFLEYDVDLAADFYRRSLTALHGRRQVVGYVPIPLTDPRFLDKTPWFTESLKASYRLDAELLVDRHLRAGGANLWTATTNLSMLRQDLDDFVDWFLPATVLFRHDAMGGHVHERMIPIYCMLRGIPNHYLPGVLQHHQKESHGSLLKSRVELET